MAEPNFLVIRAQKCGTTWLAEVLRQHPQVFLAPSDRILDVAHTFGIESVGRYPDSLRDWLEHWPRDRFEFVVYEEDIRDGDKRATVDRVCAFLGVDELPASADVDGEYNVRPGSAFLRLHHRWPLAARACRRFVPGFGRWDLRPIEVTEEERSVLRARFRPDVEVLEELIGRDLSVWPTAERSRG